MLKKYLLILLIINNCYLFSQNSTTYKSNFVSIYNFSYQKDSTDINSKKNEKMVLLMGKNLSLFQSLNSRFNDSISNYYSKIQDLEERHIMYLSERRHSKFHYKIYKKSNTITVLDKIFSDKFLYKEKTNLQWKILPETKQISIYNCQKAITFFSGRKYIAWFTKKIPISDGPYKFNGLPGLIIEIYDEKKEYAFNLLSFEKKEIQFSLNMLESKEVSKKDFFQGYSDFKKNIIGQLAQRGITPDEESLRKIKNQYKKNSNNQIEIKIE